MTTNQINPSGEALDFATLEEELVALLNGPDQAEARKALRIAEAEAEAEFFRKRNAESWKRQDLDAELRPDSVPPRTPPPQDWAALEYAKTRLNAISKASFLALGDAMRPEDVISYNKRVIESLCKLCVEKLEPYEGLLIHEQGLRRYFRSAISEWLRDRLIPSLRPLEAEAWRVYRDRVGGAAPEGSDSDSTKPEQKNSTSDETCRNERHISDRPSKTQLRSTGTAPSPAAESYVPLLQEIVAKKRIRIETWARDHKLGRTSVFDWKKARIGGTSLKGKVSDRKAAEIEKVIEDDAKALGLPTRTGSD